MTQLASNIPKLDIPFLDVKGNINTPWLMFLVQLYQRTGGNNTPAYTLTQVEQALEALAVSTANGFAGYVTGGLTPVLTIETTVVGITKGNGTALSAAVVGVDYAPPTSGTSILYGNGAGGFSNATIGTGLTFISGTLASTDVQTIAIASSNGFTGTSSGGINPTLTIATSVTGILKGNGTAISAAVSGTDYAPATSGTSILYGNGAGGFSNVTIGSGVSFVGGTLSATGSGGTITSVTASSPLASSGGTTPNISLTGTIAIANGGTNGTATPTAGAIAYGTGTAYAFTSAGTSGQVLTSAGTGIPTWSTPTTGTVTTVSVVSANGLAGTVATATTTPAITLSTSITGLLFGNGTALAAATISAPLSYSSGTLSITQATTSTNGYLSSTDWNTFNNKQPSGTYVTSVTGTAPVVSSGGTTPAISMAAASASTNGYLTSTDWNTFNSKGSGSVTSVSVVSANGFAGTVATATTTPAITLTTSITGLLKGNGTAISAATANTDYIAPSAVVTKTADFTLAATENWVINNKSGSTCTVTLPAASSWSGRYVTFTNYQTQTLVSASANVVPLGGGSAATAILLGVVGNWATLVSDGTNWIIMQAAANNCLLLE